MISSDFNTVVIIKYHQKFQLSDTFFPGTLFPGALLPVTDENTGPRRVYHVPYAVVGTESLIAGSVGEVVQRRRRCRGTDKHSARVPPTVDDNSIIIIIIMI